METASQLSFGEPLWGLGKADLSSLPCSRVDLGEAASSWPQKYINEPGLTSEKGITTFTGASGNQSWSASIVAEMTECKWGASRDHPATVSKDCLHESRSKRWRERALPTFSKYLNPAMLKLGYLRLLSYISQRHPNFCIRDLKSISDTCNQEFGLIQPVNTIFFTLVNRHSQKYLEILFVVSKYIQH